MLLFGIVVDISPLLQAFHQENFATPQPGSSPKQVREYLVKSGPVPITSWVQYITLWSSLAKYLSVIIVPQQWPCSIVVILSSLIVVTLVIWSSVGSGVLSKWSYHYQSRDCITCRTGSDCTYVRVHFLHLIQIFERIYPRDTATNQSDSLILVQIVVL